MTGTIASEKPARAWQLDVARGLAVLAMVAYHFAWDLSHFGFVELDVAFNSGWKLFAQTIAASFLVIAGASLALASRNGLNRRAFWVRIGKLAGAAGLITIATWFAFPDRFIFFGILHCIAVSSILALPFLRLNWLTIAAFAVAIILAPTVIALPAFNHPALVWIGLGTEPPMTNDFEPVFPWFGWLLAGLAAGKLWMAFSAAPTVTTPGLLSRIGRWSLLVYLLHQPLLFALFMGLGKMGAVTLAPEIKPFVQSCAVDCETSGAPYAACSAACSCVARTLRDRPIWQRVIAEKLTENDSAELSMVGRRCFDSASPLTTPPPP